MRSSISTIFAGTIALIGATGTQARDHGLVWVWNKNCSPAKVVRLRICLDGKKSYSTSLSLCQSRRGYEEGRIRFKYTPTRVLVWYGYRSDQGNGESDPGDPTPGGTELDFDFWRAGGEMDSIELGYSVLAKDGCHMNSVHIMSLSHRSTTMMAPGLILETWPVKKT